MKILLLFLLSLISVFTNNLKAIAQNELNSSWKFYYGNLTGAQNTLYNDANWTTTDLPHTWNNLDGQDGGSNFKRGIGWYRKSINIPDSYNGKSVFIRFGSANMKADVYVNGSFVGTHMGGYAAFAFDLTGKLFFGANNVLAVMVSNASSIMAPPLAGDFTFFGGITREVSLIVKDKSCISPMDYASSGVYLTQMAVSKTKAKLRIKTILRNDYSVKDTLLLTAAILDKHGVQIDSLFKEVILAQNEVSSEFLSTEMANPHLWNGMKDPYLYQVRVQLFRKNKLIDAVTQNLGLRYYEVRPDSGLFLNGSHYFLHGVAIHEDRLNKGRAISDNDRKEDLDIMGEMGCNYLRLAHYQHGAYTYNYCDNKGVILSTEIPVVNVTNSDSGFVANSKQQMVELIRQNYNHPSVLFWGLYNEINTSPDPLVLVTQLNQIAKTEDSTRITTASSNTDGSSNWVPDLISFNKYFGWYSANLGDFEPWLTTTHAGHPQSKLGVSEYGAGASLADHTNNVIRPVTTSSFHPEEYQSLFHETDWDVIKSKPYIWSSSIWAGFDFSSDNRSEGDEKGINDKGLVTRDRKVKKDAYYFYQANWTDSALVHITSRRFVQRTDSMTQVKVYSNCDSVKLDVEGINYGTIKLASIKNFIYTWAGIKLHKGLNKVSVTAYKKGTTLSDTCTWNYIGSVNNDSIETGNIQLNFQPAGAAPAGYIVDAGAKYGVHDSGYTYGWDVDISGDTRLRTSIADKVYASFVHMQKTNNRTWEMAVSNGTYKVSIACGDADFSDSFNSIEIEGKLFLEGTPDLSHSWIKNTGTVVVTDGKLTVKPSASGSNAKICLIHISAIEGGGIPQSIQAKKKEQTHVDFYPNPASTFVTVFLGTKVPAKIELIDLSGKIVYLSNDVVAEKLIIPLTKLKSGEYILQVQTKDGVDISKLIVECVM